MKRIALAMACLAAIGACSAAPTPLPSSVSQSIDGVRVVCDPTPNPTRQLSCEPAVRAGLGTAGYSPADLDFVEFHFGMTCMSLKPASPCPPASLNLGYLVFHLRDGSAVALEVWTLDNGALITAPRSFPVRTQPAAT